MARPRIVVNPQAARVRTHHADLATRQLSYDQVPAVPCHAIPVPAGGQTLVVDDDVHRWRFNLEGELVRYIEYAPKGSALPFAAVYERRQA